MPTGVRGGNQVALGVVFQANRWTAEATQSGRAAPFASLDGDDPREAHLSLEAVQHEIPAEMAGNSSGMLSGRPELPGKLPDARPDAYVLTRTTTDKKKGPSR